MSDFEDCESAEQSGMFFDLDYYCIAMHFGHSQSLLSVYNEPANMQEW